MCEEIQELALNVFYELSKKMAREKESNIYKKMRLCVALCGGK